MEQVSAQQDVLQGIVILPGIIGFTVAVLLRSRNQTTQNLSDVDLDIKWN